MRKLLFSIFSALLIAAAPAQAADKLVNGIDANFPPFAFVDAAGKPSGFDVEAMDWVARDMGVEVTHQPMEWDGIVTSLVTKKIDIIASGMTINEERAKQVAFSDPYWVVKLVMVAKKDAKITVEDIFKSGKTVGVQQGTPEAKWLKKEIEEKGYKTQLRLYNSSPLAVEDMLNGRIDAAVMDDAPAQDAASKKPVQILGTFGMPEESFGYAVRKDEPELLARVNASLKKLMASPEWKQLIAKYKLNEPKAEEAAAEEPKAEASAPEAPKAQ